MLYRPWPSLDKMVKYILDFETLTPTAGEISGKFLGTKIVDGMRSWCGLSTTFVEAGPSHRRYWLS